MSEGEPGRKGRRGLWAWGLAWAVGLVSALYIWSVLNDRTQHAVSAMPVEAAHDARELRPVAAYRAFVASPGVKPGPSHEYTALGIARLADAINAVGEAYGAEHATWAELRQMFHRHADTLRADPTARDHADIVREVFSSAVEALEHLQRTRRLDSPALNARMADLRRLADEVDAGEPLLRQQERVRRFFEGTAEVLHSLSSLPSGPHPMSK